MKKRVLVWLVLLFAMASVLAQTLTLPAGLYCVGEYFPAGRWTVTAFNPEVLTQLYRCAPVETIAEIDPAEATAIGLLEAEVYEILPGECIWIEFGDVVFTPADEETQILLEEFLAAMPDLPLLAYIGNMNTKKFHYTDCSSVKQMKDKNKDALYDRAEADELHYVPCKNCNP